MNSAIERLLSLRVSDVMNRTLVQVPANSTMADAAQVLNRAGVTGAPVVDEQGHCVGVLSGTDYALRQRSGDSGEDRTAVGEGHVLVEGNGGRPLRIDEIGNDFVTQHMSTAVQTIEGSAPLMQAARCMCAEHIHRVIILDDSQHAVGIVSSLDVVAALIKAVEE
jgi:CBS-domain-containing membrane protein